MTRLLTFILSCSFLLSLITACTPKAAGPSTPTNPTTDRTTATTTKPAKPGETLSPCPKFSDARSPEDAETNYVIYRTALKAKEMDRAMKMWRQVYATSPAADGRRPTVYTDGVAFYNNLILENPDRKQAYGDTIIMLYEQARQCYPGDGYMAGIQAFDSYYTYPGSATDEEIYQLFKESIELDGPEELQYFIINPMSRLVVDQHEAKKIDDAEAQKIVAALKTRLAKGLEECKGQNCEAWKTIESYAPSSLQYFETVKGFYDCQYYVDEYYPDFEANPTDCDAITTAYSRLKWADCAESIPEFQKVKAAYDANCEVVVSASNGNASTLRQAYDALKNGRSSEAVRLFDQAAQETDDAERKSRYLLTAAKIYYRDLRNFSQARAYARRASSANPSDGEPYMLIGTLYASSGPLCGPGTGFDSQVVVWPAIDQWQKAKSVDPSVSSKANQLIGRYNQYMPSKSDIFQRGISEGSSYTVGCWIQETTRVRTP
ncbi:tetratricopeptide (TPR) repeat protein [Lewinella aquimaris]|uniref:Tetratricopeptide (TPR) repeat protein n=1 Tax=Neolewinella aquimaris TaxID=1835722 RepID=A0A840DX23_9BACT|nr:tetratricopeptide repeat protein [Neolewinella aquimaris]MBB4077551.1 tetratricopeptide (TPR) repeat protein [Neolewinella aquimaris]